VHLEVCVLVIYLINEDFILKMSFKFVPSINTGMDMLTYELWRCIICGCYVLRSLNCYFVSA
jgi:hypothetical protein